MGASASLQADAPEQHTALSHLFALLRHGAPALCVKDIQPYVQAWQTWVGADAPEGARAFTSFFTVGEDGALAAKHPEFVISEDLFINTFAEAAAGTAGALNKPQADTFKDMVLVFAFAFYATHADAVPRPKDGVVFTKEKADAEREASWAEFERLCAPPSPPKVAEAARETRTDEGLAAVAACLKAWKKDESPPPLEMYRTFWSQDPLRLRDTVDAQYARTAQGRDALSREDMVKVCGETPFLNFCAAINLPADGPAAFDKECYRVYLVNFATCTIERQLSVARALEETKPHHQQMMLLHIIAGLVSSDGRGRARPADPQKTGNKGKLLFGGPEDATPRAHNVEPPAPDL